MDPEKLKELAKEKLGEELAQKMYGEMESMGMGPVSFAQLLENKQTKEVAEQVYDLSNMFRMLSFNICYNDMVDDKIGALETLTKEYLALVRSATTQTKSASLLDLLKEKVAGIIGKGKKEADDLLRLNSESGGNFMVFKDSSDRMRWMAIHTNKYEDYEGEIIASFAHKEFVEAVDSGRWPYPDLWIWHASSKSCVGKADMIHYDDETGFVMSTGTFHKDKEHIAEGLAKYPYPLRTSHGMPKELLIYEGGLNYKQAAQSKNYPKHIVFYRTREISPLPYGAEANKLTDFAILNGGN